MSEHGEGGGFFWRFRRSLLRAQADLKHLMNLTELKADPGSEKAGNDLLLLKDQLGKYEGIELPKILEVETASSKYVSVRRTEGGQLESLAIRRDFNVGEAGFRTRSFFLQSSALGDGQVAVLFLPSPVSYECKSRDKEREIEEELGSEIIGKYANFTFFAMVSERPDLYGANDWEPTALEATALIIRRGNNYFRLNRNSYFQKIHPDEEGKLKLVEDYWTIPGERIPMEIDEKFLPVYGKLYILQEGTGQRERKAVPQRPGAFEPIKIEA